MSAPNLVSERCKSCRYFWHINKAPGYTCCEYILKTGTRRPCPPGDACTVYKESPKIKKPKPMGPIVPYRWTPSRVALAKRLVAEGLTYRQVAEKMRSTKEAVRAVIRRERKKEQDNGTTDLL